MAFYSGVIGSCYWSCLVGTLVDSDVDDFVTALNRVGASSFRRLSVLDVTHSISLPNSLQRKKLADAAAAQPNRERVAGHAIVSNSTIAQGVLTAVNWFVPPTFPERVFKAPEPALEWLAELDGGVVPGQVLEQLASAVPDFAQLKWSR